MSDDDIPDLLETKTGHLVKTSTTSLSSVASACTSPALDVSTRRATQAQGTAGRLDPVTLRDSNGYSQLHWAVYVGDKDLAVSVLEQKKFDVNDIANEKKQTPLLWAAVMGRVELAFFLVEKGAFLDYVDFDGFSAISLAVQNGHCLLAHVLFELGADTKTLDSDGHTLLHWAVYRHQYKMTAYLLRFRDLDANAVDKSGATALHWAAMRGSDKCVSALLEHGCNIGAKDGAGKTALEISMANSFHSIASQIELERIPHKQCCGLDYSNQLFWGPLLITPFVFGALLSLSSLFLIPFVFLIWYVVKSGIAFRHIQGPGGFRSMFPYGFMSATCVGIYYFNFKYLLFLEGHFWYNFFFHLSCAVMFGCLYPFKKNVGFLTNDRKLTAAEWAVVKPSSFCSFCAIQTPVRSHHCRRCNRCVARFDHHCPWVDGCVGYQNNHIFIPMVSGGMFGHILFAIQGGLFLWAEWESAGSFKVFWNSFSVMAIFWASQFLQLVGEVMLVYSQLKNAALDVTTLEQMGFMQHGPRANLYSRGIALNLKQFFHVAGSRQIDYMTKFDGPSYGFDAAQV